jgi:hypothetical protein
MFLNKSPKEESNFGLDEIKEDEIKRFIRHEIFVNCEIYPTYNELIYEIIKAKKCDLAYAVRFMQKMRSLGLELTYESLIGLYSILRFASMRDYVTEEEVNQINQEIKEDSEQKLKENEERERRFIEKNGSDKTQWSQEVRDEWVELIDWY